MRYKIPSILLAIFILSCGIAWGDSNASDYDEMVRTDVLVVGATPCGISAAIAAARSGSKVILVNDGKHIGGMMTSGLGRTDIYPRSSAGGIFREFINNVYDYYVKTYGPDSQQVKDSSEGYYFEPSVAEKVFNHMVRGEKNIRLWKEYRLEGVLRYGNGLFGANFLDKKQDRRIQIRAGVFIDATYEGDLAAMAGVAYRVGRESRNEYDEPYAGVIYLDHLTRMVLPGSTGKGDARVQAYNFRLCLTKDPNNRVLPKKPEGYDRNEYLQVLASIQSGRIQKVDDVLNILPLPNGKSDTNNMPKGLISTDLPGENYKYPKAGYAERERIIARHRNYILGLIYFLQNDPEMPEGLRAECREWGFAKDEFKDNGNFPRQIYVREARRIFGLYTFTTHDAMLAPGSLRTPIQVDSIGCGGYPVDSHATQKKDAEHDTALEGFFWLGGMTQPYQIPYRVMIPETINGLLVPGAVSGSHLGFGTLRMEPVWMIMGQAAGTAAHLARQLFCEPRDIPVNRLQSWLLRNGQVITVFSDVEKPSDDVSETEFEAMQFYGTRGFFDSYKAKPSEIITRGTAAQWLMDAIRQGDFMTWYGPNVKHKGGGTAESSLAQMEVLGIADKAGDPSAQLTAGEFAVWQSRIRPWIDAAWGDTWKTRVSPRENVPQAQMPEHPEQTVTRGAYCEGLYTLYRSAWPVEIR